MKTNRFFSLAAMLCTLLLLSCITNLEPPPPGYSSSSIGEPSSSSSLAGISSSSTGAVLSSSAVSSSSAVPSSSSMAVSSSSVASSSSTPPSSSSSSSVPVASNCSLNGGTVNIGGQVWMAKNLNCNVSGSKCYDNQESNCTTYGRLYDWSTAMALSSTCNSTSCSSQIGSKHKGICPNGWHIPSNEDWDRLFRYADGTSGTGSPYNSPTAGRYLKSTSGWNSGGNGLDSYAFSALPGGSGYSDGYFDYVGDLGYWWSSSEGYSNYAYTRYMYYDYEDAGWDGNDKSYLFSVRCLQD